MRVTFVLVFFLCYFRNNHCQSTTTLRLVHAVFRHGDRSPTSTFPSDPHPESDWMNGYGQLTKIGMEQAYQLGVFFRKRYVTETYQGYLDNEYLKHEIYTLSTDTDRTLNTAYCMLAGLYPPTTSRKWGESNATHALGNLWQPIPVRSLEYGTDPMLCTDVECDLYDHLAHNKLESKQFHKLRKPYKDIIDYVSTNAGYKESTLQNAWDSYDPLFCMKQHSMALDWVTEDTLLKLAHLKLYQYNYMFEDKIMHKLRAGTFLNELLNNTRYAVKKKIDPRRKLNFYSSHDTLLAAVLYALETWNSILPPYTSAIMFELHELTAENYHVQVWYRNHSHENPNGPYLLKLPGCGDTCSWKQFEKFISPLALDNFHGACANVQGLTDKSNTLSSGAKAALILFAIVAVICVGATAIWCYKKRSKDFQYLRANLSGS